ncbi:MAG TPA: hypothetical protein VD713_03600 [Sphingomonadales bacterium]|nr:hypothetical protein [Sphingomonadales bacterium]
MRKMIAGFLLAVFTSPSAFAQGTACAERAEAEPSYPYKLVTHFTLELSAREADGRIGKAAYDAAMAELSKANTELTSLRTAEGCRILERIASQYRLAPPGR